MTLLPAWVPSDSIAIALVVFVLAMFLMNRGQSWFLNVVDRREPAAVAVGAFFILAAMEGWFSNVLALGSKGTWIVLGGVFLFAGLAAQYTGIIDL